MKTTLYIAGANAGMKNRCRAFSMPMNAAATAISSRNGMLIRVSAIVSSSLPGTSAYFAAIDPARAGRQRRCPSTTRTPVTTSSALMTCDPSRHAAGLAVAGEIAREGRDERRAHRAFGKQIAQQRRNAGRDAERVGRVAGAEKVRPGPRRARGPSTRLANVALSDEPRRAGETLGSCGPRLRIGRRKESRNVRRPRAAAKGRQAENKKGPQPCG